MEFALLLDIVNKMQEPFSPYSRDATYSLTLSDFLKQASSTPGTNVAIERGQESKNINVERKIDDVVIDHEDDTHDTPKTEDDAAL